MISYKDKYLKYKKKYYDLKYGGDIQKGGNDESFVFMDKTEFYGKNMNIKVIIHHTNDITNMLGNAQKEFIVIPVYGNSSDRKVLENQYKDKIKSNVDCILSFVNIDVYNKEDKLQDVINFFKECYKNILIHIKNKVNKECDIMLPLFNIKDGIFKKYISNIEKTIPYIIYEAILTIFNNLNFHITLNIYECSNISSSNIYKRLQKLSKYTHIYPYPFTDNSFINIYGLTNSSKNTIYYIDPAGSAIINNKWTGNGVSGVLYSKINIYGKTFNNTGFNQTDITNIQNYQVVEKKYEQNAKYKQPKINDHPTCYVLHVYARNLNDEKNYPNEVKVYDDLNKTYRSIIEHLNNRDKDEDEVIDIRLPIFSSGIYAGDYFEYVKNTSPYIIMTQLYKYTNKNKINIYNDQVDILDKLFEASDIYHDYLKKYCGKF
jgi:hypothetical protein